MSSIIGTRVGSLIGTRVGTDGVQPNYFDTAAKVAANTGITPQSLYLFNETSGALVDSVGGLNLAAVNTPTYRYQVDDRPGVYYDAQTDAHIADVNDLAAASGLYAAIFRAMPTVAVATFGIIARLNATAVDGLAVYTSSGVNYVSALVRDSGANELLLNTVGIDVKNPSYVHLVTMQVDRAAAIARMRISRPGGLVAEVSGSIAGFATLTGPAQSFGFGAAPALSGGNAVSWAMTAVGAQCQGAGVPAAIARGLGFES